MIAFSPGFVAPGGQRGTRCLTGPAFDYVNRGEPVGQRATNTIIQRVHLGCERQAGSRCAGNIARCFEQAGLGRRPLRESAVDRGAMQRVQAFAQHGLDRRFPSRVDA